MNILNNDVDDDHDTKPIQDWQLAGFIFPVAWTHQMLCAVDDQVPFVVVHWDDDVAFPVYQNCEIHSSY